MYARIPTWRIVAEDGAALDREVSPVVAGIKAHPGYVAGYLLRSAPDTVMILTIWEGEASMETAFVAASPQLAPLVRAGQMERIDVQTYPAAEWG